MSTTTNAPKSKQTKLLFIVLVVLGAFILLGIVGYAIAANTKDNISNYTGVRQEIARKAIEFDNGFNSDYPFRSMTKPQIIAVEPSSQGANPLRCTDDPNDARYYSVTVKRVWLFGFNYSQVTYNGCNLIP